MPYTSDDITKALVDIVADSIVNNQFDLASCEFKLAKELMTACEQSELFKSFTAAHAMQVARAGIIPLDTVIFILMTTGMEIGIKLATAKQQADSLEELFKKS